MRILKITDVYFPRVNGVSTSIRTFRRELAAAGHEVTLVAPDYGEATDDEDGIIRIPSCTVVVDPEDRMMKMNRIMALREELASRQFDLVHIHTPFVAHYAGLRLASALGIPAVETYHTYFEEYLFNYVRWLPRGWLRWLARGFSRRQCNSVDAVVVPSCPMRDVLENYGVSNSMKVIPTGIDLAEFAEGDGQQFRRINGIGAERRVLVFVGRLAFEKNIHFLIDVVDALKHRFPGILLLLAGEGPAHKNLESVVEARGLQCNVVFIGNLSRGVALNDCYAAGDVFVFASRTETQGLVLLEAMALGVPVVSTAVMGTRDVLVDGCGCMIAEETVNSFADKITWLLENPARRGLLAESGMRYVEKWTAANMADRMVGLYARITAQEAPISDEVVFEES